MAICPSEVCRPRVIPLVFHPQQSGPGSPTALLLIVLASSQDGFPGETGPSHGD